MKDIYYIEGLKIISCGASNSNRIAYVLYPMETLKDWIEEAANKYNVSIAVITGMDWDNDLTPWPAKGVPRGCPDFKGEASAFIKKLKVTVVPEVEKRLGLHNAERTLVGVSLSGLFTLWQWSSCDVFRNIASLSGSFWYEGFMEWFNRQEYSRHAGSEAFFVLGDKESHSKIKAFEPVEVNTKAIVAKLQAEGVDATFTSVPGNHYQFPIERLNLAFKNLYS